VTLNDVEWPSNDKFFFYTDKSRIFLCAEFDNDWVKTDEDKLTLSAAVRYAGTLVSGNIRFMPNFAGVFWRGGVKRRWVVENGFSLISVSISSEALEIKTTLLYSIIYCLIGFPLIPNTTTTTAAAAAATTTTTEYNMSSEYTHKSKATFWPARVKILRLVVCRRSIPWQTTLIARLQTSINLQIYKQINKSIKQ